VNVSVSLSQLSGIYKPSSFTESLNITPSDPSLLLRYKMVGSKANTSTVKKSQTFIDPSSVSTEITWVLNKTQTIYFPFSEATGKGVMEFNLKGIVNDVYLRAGAFSHSIMVKVDEDKVRDIKDIVLEAPNCKDADDYHWPITGNVVKLTSKEGLDTAFENVWKIDNEKLVRNEELRRPISIDEITKGSRVYVEFTPVSYNGRSSKLSTTIVGTEGSSTRSEGYKPGCTFRLYSIGLLDKHEDVADLYDFESAKKKRRMG
jgi:hypothetical protein